VQSAQEREIDAGHCHALPPSMCLAWLELSSLATPISPTCFAGRPGWGVVLLAGQWTRAPRHRSTALARTVKNRVFAVGYLEIPDDSTPVTAFDAVVRTAVAERADPCAEFKRRAADK
jgi:hypothetical protein